MLLPMSKPIAILSLTLTMLGACAVVPVDASRRPAAELRDMAARHELVMRKQRAQADALAACRDLPRPCPRPVVVMAAQR